MIFDNNDDITITISIIIYSIDISVNFLNMSLYSSLVIIFVFVFHSTHSPYWSWDIVLVSSLSLLQYGEYILLIAGNSCGLIPDSISIPPGFVKPHSVGASLDNGPGSILAIVTSLIQLSWPLPKYIYFVCVTSILLL